MSGRLIVGLTFAALLTTGWVLSRSVLPADRDGAVLAAEITGTLGRAGHDAQSGLGGVLGGAGAQVGGKVGGALGGALGGAGAELGVDVTIGREPPAQQPPPANPPARDGGVDSERDAGMLLGLGRAGIANLIGQLGVANGVELQTQCTHVLGKPPGTRGIGPNLRALCRIILSLGS